MKLAPALSMGLALLPGMVSAGGGFYNSCKENWHMEGNLMITECKKANGQYMRSRQDMNLCIGNSFGTLRAADNGGFTASCGACQQGQVPYVGGQPPTPYIACSCKNGNGNQEAFTNLNLNDFVENRDGYIWCFGHRSAAF
ncbi:hypothetical protein C8A01DRAFT_35569 [Parachaetomium inaequale]|uniref:Cyanovirin-N domain-containing protein n=1 Tax=Parachaetomium inaequale TaxID=2588326 RepID=A0AAN6PGQ5_9PEZI|nr:hypothetical protein C8A01DRAFT_35569 [Parachaetomium inaequale]